MTANGLTTMFLGEKKNRTSKAALLNLSFSRAACLPFAIILLCGRVETNSINPVSQGKVTGQKPCIHAGLSRFDGYSHSLGKLRDEEQQTFYDAILEDVTTIMPDEESVFWEEDGYFNFECRVENTKEIRSMYGSFLFMGISLGFVFTMAAVLIIYYKQISEGMEDKNRFAIMQQVGLSQKEVKHSIHTQILTVFFLPLITAGIHVMFAYPIIRAILRAMMLSSETVFITCTVASFLVFSVLYAVVYALTAKVYYRIISEDNK